MTKRRAFNSSLPAPAQSLARRTPLRSSGRPHRHARPASDTLRAHGDEAFRTWIKGQPCVLCGRTPSDAAHLKSGGTGRKADVAFVVPLCSTIVAAGYSGHHDEYDGRQHAGGKRSFAAKYQLDLLALAAQTQAAWRAHLARREG